MEYPVGKILRLNKYIFYFVVVVADWFCQSNALVHLNHTTVLVNESLNINNGFSFGFRTCASGVLLQADNNLTISIETTQLFPKLSLSWQFNDSKSEKSVSLQPLYSLNSNLEIIIDFFKNDTGFIFSATPKSSNSEINKTQFFILSKYFYLYQNTSSFSIGSNDFQGCIYNGRNFNVNVTSDSCILDFDQPCFNKKCPTGFTGRYCETNIDDCNSQKKQCHLFSECEDLINDFRCICKAGWTGRYCDNNTENFCEPNPCENGLCRLTNDKSNYTCTCPIEYTGRNCSDPNFPCFKSLCQNGGICYNSSVLDYNCTCVSGYAGVHCENNIDNCANRPCSFGQCIDLVNNFTCNCNGSGLTGDLCMEDINECSSIISPCKNNASCKNKYASYDCTCTVGFTGKNCEIDIDDCASNPCFNGTCNDKTNGYNCSCNPGYKGKHCDIDIDECLLGFCKNNASCKNLVNDYICQCEPGYTGKNCDAQINECESQPCNNNGTCHDQLGSYRCECRQGYNGTNCTENIDDCSSVDCGNGSCSDLLNNYICNCHLGYTGKHCEVNIDDCSPTACLNYGTCVDGVQNFACVCIPSYTGRHCETYQDPCVNNPCLNNAACLNDTTKGYYCNCTDGFGGQNCQYKVGLCFPKNPCAHGKCNESNGEYDCTCEKGYDGLNCSQNINECNIKKQCENKGRCVDTPGSFNCNCFGTGYNGHNCSDEINECEVDNPCLNNAKCFNLPGSFYCDCRGGFVGKTCGRFFYACPEYRIEKKEEYCLNNGFCNEIGNLLMNCTCAPGYKGVRCATEIDECALNFCNESTSCTDLINDYNCTCIPGWTGKNCSININECDPDPCQNNATCLDLINDYSCECKLGYNGTLCENDIDWCSYKPCQFGSKCTDILETYTCDCFPGFSGKNCSTDFADCSPNPCVYNNTVENTCIEKSNITAMKLFNYTVNETSFHNRDGFICKCIEGLSGENCTNNKNDCNNTLCVNNGTCVDLINDFKCICPEEYTGKTCESNKNGCFSSPCQNNGLCASEDVLFTCFCKPGFTGNMCQHNTTASFHGNGVWSINNIEPSQSLNVSIKINFITTIPNNALLTLTIDNYLFLISLQDSFPVIKSINSSNLDQIWSNIPLNNNQWHSLALEKAAGLTTWHIFIDDAKVESVLTLGSQLTDVNVGGYSSPVKLVVPYVGCMRDIKLNNKTLAPSLNGTSTNVLVGLCNRSNVCDLNACNQHGSCEDFWTYKTCSCFTQYYGETCSNEIKAFSFPLPPSTNSTRKRRSTANPYVVSSSLQFTMDNLNNSISFLIRTRAIQSIIAVLLSSVPASGSDNFSYYLIQMNDGYLEVISFHDGNTKKHKLSSKVNTGLWQDITINTNKVTHNKISEVLVKQLDVFTVNKVFVGGIDRSNAVLQTLVGNLPGFNGCMQAFKLGATVLTQQDISVMQTANVSLNGVEEGCVGHNGCSAPQCLFGGVCNDLWDEFNCTCPMNFEGKTCNKYGCQVKNECSIKSDCVDVPNQPGDTKCSMALTYNGYNSSTDLRVSSINKTTLSFALRTRQKNGVIMATVGSMHQYFIVGLTDGRLTLRSKYLRNGDVMNITGPAVDDGKWHDIFINNETIKDSNHSHSFTNQILDSDWLALISNHTLKIGLNNVTVVSALFQDVSFKGCLKNLFIGSSFHDLTNAVSTNTMNNCTSDNPCSDQPCVNNSTCIDIFNDFQCQCLQYYDKKTCNETKDISCDFNPTICHNNGACVALNKTTAVTPPQLSENGRDFFKCDCLKGFEGYSCQTNIDECAFNFCQNFDNCSDLINDYNCSCQAGWEGKNCSQQIDECAVLPCKNNANCTDLLNDYNCTCANGYKGKNCDADVNECTSNTSLCENQSQCENTIGSYNCTCGNGTFGRFCQHNNTELCEIKTPCLNSGACSDNITGFYCSCVNGYYGSECQYTGASEKEEEDNIPLIVGVTVGVILLIIIIIIIVIFRYCRDKSGMEGTYSPNKEEQQSGTVEMNTLKKPNAERLI